MKKKKLAVLAIFFVTSANSIFGQKLGVSISNSITTENTKGFSIKDKTGQCLNLYYYFSEEQALAIQLRNSELWKHGSGPTNFVPFKTLSFQYILCGNTETGPEIFLVHQVGVSAAIGTPFYKENADQHLLKTALFSGVLLELGVGKRISKKLILVFSVKSEGVYGLIRDGYDDTMVGGANGFISLSLRLELNQFKTKDPS